MTETAIASAIRQMKGQVALQQALWLQEGVSVTQQAISLWKTQGYAPENRHAPLARLMSRGDVPLENTWRRALARDVELASLNKSAGA